jgi:protein-L-isoaspartate(D-aspartate) O-methyltransferase
MVLGAFSGSRIAGIIAERPESSDAASRVPAFTRAHNRKMDETAARLAMVQHQIADRGIRDARVLAAMRDVPRHLFVPPEHRAQAYEDHPVPIGAGQTISQPYMVAIMSAALGATPSDRVLEVGTGSGYQTAILARLAAHVVSIERHASLAGEARQRLSSLGIRNAEIRVGDGSEGAPDLAPFDRILVAAGAPAVPETLRASLAERGRLVIPVGPPGYQRLTVVQRDGDQFLVSEGEACTFVPLIGRHGWAGSR